MANNISLPKGLKINEYTIAKKLSLGGFSVVYLAYHKSGMPVAIKEFFPNHLHLRKSGYRVEFINMREKHRFQEGLKAFKDETEIVMKLKHKNIIEIVNFFEMNGTAYIVMPYEYGMTLSKYISTETSHNEQEIISIIEGVFSAVQMFHEHNIIHLDLKPGNIWLRPNKEALILDFGTARIIDDPIKSKQPPMHTPGYAAPEQHKEFFQPPRVGVWTDYYGLGATLYALLEKASPVPSPELLLNSTKVNIMARRKGQFSNSILNIVDYLMQTEWDKRKKINLKEVIESLSKIKPSKEIEMVTNELDKNLKSARKSFMDISKATEDN
jgi:serine/threonine protein kinase